MTCGALHKKRYMSSDMAAPIIVKSVLKIRNAWHSVLHKTTQRKKPQQRKFTTKKVLKNIVYWYAEVIFAEK